MIKQNNNLQVKNQEVQRMKQMKQMTTMHQTIIIFVFHNFGLEP